MSEPHTILCCASSSLLIPCLRAALCIRIPHAESRLDSDLFTRHVLLSIAAEAGQHTVAMQIIKIAFLFFGLQLHVHTYKYNAYCNIYVCFLIVFLIPHVHKICLLNIRWQAEPAVLRPQPMYIK